MTFPRHNCGLYLTHNAHKDVYETAERCINHWNSGNSPHWKDAEAKDRAIATNEIWELQWYALTPVSFMWVAAPTLDECLELAMACEEDLK